MVKEIKLTQGQVAQVDDADFDWLNEFKWYALFCPSYSGGGGFLACRKKEGKPAYMHRVIMERVSQQGIYRRDVVDHVNGDTLDNKRSNLRVVTRSQNAMNRGTISNNVSGFKGVSWHKQRQKWQAQIIARGERTHLGYFTNPEEAGAAYKTAAEELHGEYQRR